MECDITNLTIFCPSRVCEISQNIQKLRIAIDEQKFFFSSTFERYPTQKTKTTVSKNIFICNESSAFKDSQKRVTS